MRPCGAHKRHRIVGRKHGIFIWCPFGGCVFVRVLRKRHLRHIQQSVPTHIPWYICTSTPLYELLLFFSPLSLTHIVDVKGTKASIACSTL